MPDAGLILEGVSKVVEINGVTFISSPAGAWAPMTKKVGHKTNTQTLDVITMVTPASDLITNAGAVDPTTPAEWDDWVSPSKMPNHVLGTPVCDWLERMQERV
ncbi:MAG: hypothetical protein MKZ55_01255, partial [Candidatus Thalassarchaeum sp.]|nr:hypothetical protein [Candidatus Thalassarchaeum sp.]